MTVALTKKFLLGGVFASGLILGACVADEADHSLKITSQSFTTNAVVGDTLSFKVTVRGTAPFSYQWILSYLGSVDTLPDTSDEVRIRADANVSGKSMEVIVRNDAEEARSMSSEILLAYGPADTLSLGAQSNLSFGSAIDLDSCKVWGSENANSNQSKIDLVYLFYNGAATLNGAEAARDSGRKYSVPLTADYDALQVEDVKFVKVLKMPVNLKVAESAYTLGEKVRATALTAGDKFVVRSTEGSYHYLEVRRVTSTSSGSLALKVFLGDIRQ